MKDIRWEVKVLDVSTDGNALQIICSRGKEATEENSLNVAFHYASNPYEVASMLTASLNCLSYQFVQQNL